MTTADARLEQLRAAAAAFGAVLADMSEPSPEALAAALEAHLSDMRTAVLTAGAAESWTRLLAMIARAGRAVSIDEQGRLPGDVAGRIAAWPRQRVVAALVLVETAARDLEREMDALWNDVVRERVARAYL